MEFLRSKDDFSTSVEKALDEINRKWRDLPGLLIVGSHTPSDVEEKIKAIKRARLTNTPFLGICMGMQLMAIEWARTQLLIKDATSAEIGDGKHIITKLPRLHVGIDKVAGWWGTTDESHWHNYSFNTAYIPRFEVAWDFSVSDDGIVEIMRYKHNRFLVGVQFHPEYQSTPKDPHPVLLDFIETCSTFAA